MKEIRNHCGYLLQRKREQHSPIIIYTVRYLTNKNLRTKGKAGMKVLRDNCSKNTLNELRTTYIAYTYHTDQQLDSLIYAYAILYKL